MKYDVYDGINFLLAAENLDQLKQVFDRLIQKFGVDQFALQFTPIVNKALDIYPVAIANYKQEWVDRYFEENYHKVDPLILVGSKKVKPFFWSDTWEDATLHHQAKKMFVEAKDYGLRSGIGIPIISPLHTNGMVTLVSSFAKDDTDLKKILGAQGAALHVFCLYFQQMAHYFVVRDKIKIHSVELSKREKECLYLALQTKTNAEIGAILKISKRTVEAHFKNCCRKLNAVNKQQAVAKAIITKSIDLNDQ